MTTQPCPDCGEPMTPGGFAIACGPPVPGKPWTSTRVPLPNYCNRPECVTARGEAAIARAIAAGVIDP